MGSKEFGYDFDVIKNISEEISTIYNLGVKISIVVGGGNICRGSSFATNLVDRINADFVGMLSTVMNGLVLQSSLKKFSVRSKLFSSINIDGICDLFSLQKSLWSLEKGNINIFVAGTGHPYFTTDTASVLRANEMECDVLLKGTQVDGVYDKDPHKYSDAKRFNIISFDEVINRNLKVMDLSAFTLARDNNIPILVFNIAEKNSILNVLKGNGRFSLVSKEGI